jgi:hypothetical protein
MSMHGGMNANSTVCDEDPGLRIESFAVITLRGDWCFHKHNYYMFYRHAN